MCGLPRDRESAGFRLLLRPGAGAHFYWTTKA